GQLFGHRELCDETGGWIASIGVKVPEVLLSGRVVPFIDATSKTVTVTNTGDAVLSITSVRVTGVDSAVFAKRSDTCGGRSFNPGASCVVELARRAGGASGVESAALEIADNATGTPQKVSLVAQLGTCRLPVVARGANQAPQGEFIDMTTGRAVYDPTGAFEVISEPSYSVQTVSRPVLAGNSAGYYDQSARRWLPAYDSAAISPDHASYAYSSYDASGTGNRIHVVEIGTGADRVLSLDQGFWGVVGYTEQGIYANQRYEGVGPGLWLINPDTGATRKVVVSETVDKVSGSTAWLGYWDPQDKAPQPPGEGGADNAILKRDLATGATTRWYYRSGANVGVVGVVGDGVVVNVYDGATSQLFWVPSPGTAQGMAFPFTSETFPSFSGFVGDAMGVWVGSEDGLYLWTARTGGVLVSTEVATPAGTCG
ncbi:MAG TPA: hypothetical protein VLK30_10195, partial [Candidatus Limnocylindrales bacterium]|nr:hypothetical protein [Candidatus Limnocylindrales bacterium]